MALGHQLPTPESAYYYPSTSTQTAPPCPCPSCIPAPSQYAESSRMATVEYPTPPTSARAAKRELEARKLPPIPQLGVDTHWVCDMICHLWFGTSSYTHSPSFPSFLHKLLSTTQLSPSSILLAMYYIRLLKAMNPTSPTPQPGSEFRIAVAALMASNKYLEDNTYTNKTWAEVSGIRALEIERMEREFLSGVGWKLRVEEHVWKAWVRWVGDWREGAMPKKRKAENVEERRSYRKLPRLDMPPQLVPAYATTPQSSPLSARSYSYATPPRRASSYATPPSSATRRSYARTSSAYSSPSYQRASSTYSSPSYAQTSPAYRPY